MKSRRLALFVLALAVSSLAASYRTTNFIVQAPTRQVAQQVAQYAERYRKEKALQWLGKEMPPWGRPCPIRVTLTPGGAGGATTFAFDRGSILSQEMNVQGSLERILNSVLPHEVTHTVFAYHFRRPLPRWADEGGSVLSEDDIERRRHDDLVRRSLASGRAFRLRVLFEMRNYPTSGSDVMTLYAQGYSLSRFLVESSSRPGFLNFVADGMRYGWDQAIRKHYQLNSVEELEAVWLDWMRGTFQPQMLAQRSQRGRNTAVVRGASPDEPRRSAPSRSAAPRSQPTGWSPAVRRTVPPKARLGRPMPDPNWSPPTAQRAIQSQPRP